jgi:hypothetical protein
MPNIDETYNFPFNAEDFLSSDRTKQLDFMRQLFTNLQKMYEEIAIGINQSFRMKVLSSTDVAGGTPLTNLPLIGASIVIVSGLETTQPQAVFSVLKPDYNASATVTALDFIAGTAGVWNTVTLSMPVTATTTSLVHSGGAGVTGQFEVTILGSQKSR